MISYPLPTFNLWKVDTTNVNIDNHYYNDKFLMIILPIASKVKKAIKILHNYKKLFFIIFLLLLYRKVGKTIFIRLIVDFKRTRKNKAIKKST